MEPLPQGANFKRAKILWELGLNIAGNPETKYGGNRDVCIAVGSGSCEGFKPWLKIASGSAIMAHAVAKGEIDMAFVNPSAMLTQAYRGVGLFNKALPLRIVGSYPSFDRFVMTIRSKLGFKSLHDIKKAKYPLHVSLREDPTHSTLVLVSQMLALHGMSIAELESWGGKVHPCGGPGDKRRINAIHDGSIDAIFDEGISTWINVALGAGMEPLDLDDAAYAHLGAFGWRRVPLGAGRFAHLPKGHDCIDFSGWPLYARADIEEKMVIEVCEAFGARHEYMPWENGTHEGLWQIGHETDATPMDVPLHPAAEKWWKHNAPRK